MEEYSNKQIKNKTFKQILHEKNEREFYDNFITGIGNATYRISGLGDDMYLSEKQLLTMIQCSSVQFDLIHSEFSNLILNGLPITVEMV